MFSIRWKLILSYVLLSVTTAVAVGVISFLLINGYVRKKGDEQMQLTAESIEAEIRPLFRHGSAAEIEFATDTLGMINNLRIRVLDLRKEVLADSHSGEIRLGAEFQSLERMRSEIERRRIPFDPGSPRGMAPPSGRVFTLPVREEGGVLGYIELQNPPDLVDSTLRRSRLYLILAGAAATAVAILIGLVMGRRLTSPILALSSAVRGMEEGDLSIRANIQRSDEIGELASRVNRMADRIENSIETLETERDSLKTFAEDASHELRTPVTALRTFNELLLGKSGDDPNRRREFLTDSKKQLDRMHWIVQALLSLTRFDSDLMRLHPEEIDISTIVVDAVSGYSARIEEKRLAVDMPETGCVVVCDKESIATAISNIIDNAITYAPSTSTVSISCSSIGNSTHIRVTDQGPGIEDHDLPHIFKRFYRSKTNTAGGSGLGLALADSIVKAHRGQILVDTAAERGVSFEIVLPTNLLL